jgi:hypothetical protein
LECGGPLPLLKFSRRRCATAGPTRFAYPETFSSIRYKCAITPRHSGRNTSSGKTQQIDRVRKRRWRIAISTPR